MDRPQTFAKYQLSRIIFKTSIKGNSDEISSLSTDNELIPYLETPRANLTILGVKKSRVFPQRDGCLNMPQEFFKH